MTQTLRRWCYHASCVEFHLRGPFQVPLAYCALNFDAFLAGKGYCSDVFCTAQPGYWILLRRILRYWQRSVLEQALKRAGIALE